MTEQELSEELLFTRLQGNSFLANHFPALWKQQRQSTLTPNPSTLALQQHLKQALRLREPA